MKKYIGPVLSLASVGLLFYIVYNQKGQIKDLKTSLESTTHKMQTVDSLDNEIKVLNSKVDSLSNELFIEHTNVDRYTIALDKLYEIDSLAGIEFEQCLHQTE